MKSNERGNFESKQSKNGSEWDSLSNYEVNEKTDEQANRERHSVS